MASSFLRLILLARPQWPGFVRLGLIGLLVTATNVVSAVLVAKVLTRILDGQRVGNVVPFLVGAIGALIVRAALLWVQSGTTAEVGGAITDEIRERTYRKLLALGPSWLTAARTGTIQAMLVDGVEMLQGVYARLVTQTVVSLIAGVALGIYVVILDPVVGAIVLGCLLIVPFVPPLIETVLGHPAKFWRDSYFGMTAEYLDNLQGMTTLKMFGASERRGRDLGARARELRDRAITLCNRQIGFSGVVNLLVGVGAASSLGVGAIRNARSAPAVAA